MSVRWISTGLVVAAAVGMVGKGASVAAAVQRAVEGAPETRLGVAVEDQVERSRRGLAERERAALLREAAAAAAEKRAAARLVELGAERERLRTVTARREEQDSAQVNSLARVYTAMRPKEAARVIENLDLNLQVRVIRHMRERAAASIFGQMDPAAAARLSLALARAPGAPVPSATASAKDATPPSLP